MFASHPQPPVNRETAPRTTVTPTAAGQELMTAFNNLTRRETADSAVDDPQPDLTTTRQEPPPSYDSVRHPDRPGAPPYDATEPPPVSA